MGLLDGKVAIVTGAGHGIGRGEALELAAQGATVLVNDIGGSVSGEGADKRPAEEVAGIIRERGGTAMPDFNDVGNWSGAADLVAHAVEEFGRLDILVNNAGILRDGMIVNLTEADFDAVIRVHLKGTVACTHHAAAHWRQESKEGRQPRAAIVNTVSSAGLQGNVGQIAYGAAKAGIASATVIASLELARYGVRANAIAPGGFTRMVGAAMKDIDVREADEFADDEFDRMNPGNSAPMVAWLASDQALHVTGQVFRAVGSNITHYEPWRLGAEIETEGKWDPTSIGAEVNAHIFRSRAPGLAMPGRS